LWGQGAGNAVRPQMPDLVGCMLESLSSLEDQRLNYAEVLLYLLEIRLIYRASQQSQSFVPAV